MTVDGAIRIEVGAVMEDVFVMLMGELEVSKDIDSWTAGVSVTGVVDCDTGAEGSPPS